MAKYRICVDELGLYYAQEQKTFLCFKYWAYVKGSYLSNGNSVESTEKWLSNNKPGVVKEIEI